MMGDVLVKTNSNADTTGARPGTRASNVRWARIAFLLVCLVALFVVGRTIADMLVGEFRMDLSAGREPILHRAIMTATSVYIVTMATPFMPGVEIGLGMLMMFGGRISFLVYVSTVAALVIAYAIGRFLSVALAARLFDLLGFQRARDFVARLAPLSGGERMNLLAQEAPGRWGPFLLRHRYLLLAIVLNVPGNIVIGGGGGIALVAGMTRLFSFPLYLLTVALATLPVPLIVALTG